jgi:solute:Na+ symporter, SSS family
MRGTMLWVLLLFAMLCGRVSVAVGDEADQDFLNSRDLPKSAEQLRFASARTQAHDSSGKGAVGPRLSAKSHFGLLNYGVLASYLACNLGVGWYLAKRQKNTNDFFRCGQRIPWWAAGIALCGTQLSTLTFMAIPAKTYATDWTYILVNASIPLVAPIVVYCYLPFFRRLDVTTAYEYLEKRFNLAVRLFGSATFVLLQTSRMAIVLFLPSLALSVVSDLNLYVCILGMGLLSTLYTLMGGAEAVTWTEVLQAVILFGSAILTLVLIAHGVSGGFGTLLAIAQADGKLHVANWSWDFTVASVWVVLLGNLFAQLIPYTTDQAVIQRYLSTPDEKQAGQAIWTNALITIPASLIFFGIGTALYGFYKEHPQLLNPGLQMDAIFPWYIVSQMPPGVSGLVIAGLFAAGQSGTQSSVATAIVTDFHRRFHQDLGEERLLQLARMWTVILGFVGMGAATLIATFSIQSLWDVFLAVVGLFGGGLAGIFALGIFTQRAHGVGALIGGFTSALVLFVVQRFTPLHFFLYAPVGILSCFLIGYLASRIIPSEAQNLKGLTIYHMSSPRKTGHGNSVWVERLES